MTDPDDLIEVMSRRHDIVRSLLDAPKERHVLVDYLDDSKSTVYKGVSQLQELGLIQSTPEGLQPTLFGTVALERYDELAQTADLGDLLNHLPREAIEPSALAGAEAVTPDSRSVDRHLARVEEMLRKADAVRGFSPAVSPEYVSIFHQRTIDDGLTAELVLTKDIVIHLRQEYSAAFDDALSANNVMLYQTDTEVPFTLLLLSSTDGTEVCVELSGEEVATGLIVNDSTECIRWAEEEYERHKQAAEEVAP